LTLAGAAMPGVSDQTIRLARCQLSFGDRLTALPMAALWTLGRW